MELSDITTPALAYLGDSVLEVCVRTYLTVERGLSTSAHLNRASLDFVRASAQSEAVGRMEPYLTEAEAAVYRRATGMEVLFGSLHVTGQTERMNDLFRLGYGLISPDEHTTSQAGDTQT